MKLIIADFVLGAVVVIIAVAAGLCEARNEGSKWYLRLLGLASVVVVVQFFVLLAWLRAGKSWDW